jgi:regulatory protein
MRLLARREHSRAELERKLGGRGHESAHLAQALDWLIERGWLSDSRFAEQYVRSRINRGFGPRKIQAGLRDRGVHSALAQSAVGAAEVIWRELCDEVKRRRFGAARPADRKDWLKQARFLMQRGFSEGHVRAVLDGARNDN